MARMVANTYIRVCGESLRAAKLLPSSVRVISLLFLLVHHYMRTGIGQSSNRRTQKYCLERKKGAEGIKGFILANYLPLEIIGLWHS